MTAPNPSNRSLRHRIKLAAVSFLGLLIPSACSTVTQPVCYAPLPPTDTPTPFVTCYTAPPPTETPTPTPFTSPISPLPTPTPASTAEARRLLLDRLLSEERFPDEVARDLES
jgi:hypothetical protein